MFLHTTSQHWYIHSHWVGATSTTHRAHTYNRCHWIFCHISCFLMSITNAMAVKQNSPLMISFMYPYRLKLCCLSKKVSNCSIKHAICRRVVFNSLLWSEVSNIKSLRNVCAYLPSRWYAFWASHPMKK